MWQNKWKLGLLGVTIFLCLFYLVDSGSAANLLRRAAAREFESRNEVEMSTQTGEDPQPVGLSSNASPPVIIDPQALPVAGQVSGSSVIVPIQYADPAEVQQVKQGETVLPAVDVEASDQP